jgi:hypothetical protein
MNGSVVKKPMAKGAFWTHHVWILLRAHPLFVFLSQPWAVALLLRLASRSPPSVRWRAVLVRLRYHGRLALELLGERSWTACFRGCMSDGERE